MPETAGTGRAVPLAARLGRWAASRPWAVLLGTGLLVAGALVAAAGLRLETDLAVVLAEDDPAVRDFLETTERFGSLDRLWIVLHLPTADDDGDGPDRQPHHELADRIAAGLEELPEIDSVSHRLPDPAELSRALAPWAALWIDPDDLDRLAETLSAPGLRAAAATTRRRLLLPSAAAEGALLRADPFHLLPLVAAGSELPIDPALRASEGGHLVSPDGRLLLIEARAVRPAHDVPFARRLIAAAREVVAREEAAVRRELEPDSRGGFEPAPAITGAYALAAADVERVEKDLARTSLLALAAVGLLLFLAFGRPLAFVLAVGPLAAGIALTAGLAALTVGRLSSLTASTAALLVGLGVDFTIVLLERYGEERRRGRPAGAAAAAMLGSTGRGVVVGAATTAVTFFCFLVSSFRGLFELGWLAGAGILLCLGATFLLLPALLGLAERSGRARGEPRAALRMRSFGSGRLVGWCRRRPGATLTAWAVFLALAALGLPRLSFDVELESLRSADHEVLAVQREVGESFGLSRDRLLLRLDGDEPDALLDAARRLRRALDPWLEDGTLRRVVALPDLVPPRADQEAVLAALDAGRDDRFSPTRVAEDARRALAAEGLAPAAFEPAIGSLAAALDPPGPIDLERLAEGPLRPWLERLLVRDETAWSTVLYLESGRPGVWQEAEGDMARLAAEHGAAVVGAGALSEALRRQTWRDLARAAPLALLAVWIVLVLDFRSLRLAALAFLPVVPGLLLLLGAAGALAIPLSLVNLFVVVLVLGIGVDYGVHVVHRFREARSAGGATEHQIDTALAEISKAVLVASLTTALGFGSLALSGFAGLRSVGWLSVFGTLGAGLAALTLVPALLHRATSGSGRRPGGRARRVEQCQTAEEDGTAEERVPVEGEEAP